MQPITMGMEVENLSAFLVAGLADSFAALGVSGIVIWVSLQLIKETIDALLDRAPEEFATQIRNAIRDVEGITEVRRVRVRRAGNKLFADVVIAAPRIYAFV